jgi:hypothetical protein
MLIALWNPHGFYVVTMLPPRAPFNVSWFIDGSVVPLVEKFFPVGLSAERSKLVVRYNNVPVHNSRMTQSFFGRNPPKSFRIYRFTGIGPYCQFDHNKRKYAICPPRCDWFLRAIRESWMLFSTGKEAR